jgi:hypothetical protein
LRDLWHDLLHIDQVGVTECVNMTSV